MSISSRKYKYTFSVNWFERNVDKWNVVLDQFKIKKINVLEIGAFEGASTTWMLEELLLNPESKIISIDTFKGSCEHTEDPNINDNLFNLEERFHSNIQKSGKQNQISVIKNNSYDALIQLNYQENMLFNFIYIDGSHKARDVMSDAVLAWNLLDINGFMIFDDYKWDHYHEEYDNPRIAVDSFIRCFRPELEIIDKDYQVIIKKIKSV